MKHCVVHPRGVSIEINNTSLSKKTRKKARRVESIIKRIMNDPNTIIFEDEDPRKIADFFNPNEEVTLYGAHLGMCLPRVYNDMKHKNIKVYYHPNGCF